MKLKILFTILFVILLISFASAGLCYQESANVSTSCGGLNTGLYNYSGSFTDVKNTFDGNWSSYGYAAAYGSHFVYINYSKPSTFTNLSFIQYKSQTTYANYSINSTNCWDYSQSVLSIRIGMLANTTSQQNNLSCFNGTGWEILYDGVFGSINETIVYEEGIYWGYDEVSLTSPTNNLNTISTSKIFIANYTFKEIGVPKNATLYLWYQNGTIANTNYSTVNNLLNSSSLSLSLTGNNSYYWNYKVYIETAGGGTEFYWSNYNFTLNKKYFIENSQTYNSTSYETSQETFYLNISADGLQTITANLIYDGTTYTSTKIGNSHNVSFSRTITIPTVNSKINKTFYWDINYGGVHTYSNYTNQTINQIVFGLCNASLTMSYINFSFADEINSTKINVSIPSSNFSFWIGDGSVKKSMIFSNNSYNPSYTFCFIPSDKSINTYYTLQYQGNGYPQRISQESIILTNSTYNKELYLLNTANGQYVTFSVINAGQQTISGVFVNATRSISGSLVLVGNGYTDSAGSITFFLNQNFAHTFNFLKDGYSPLSQTITPTQSIYTIKLSTTGTTSYDYRQGVSISINPSDNFLDNNTIYNFNMTISSSIYSLSEFGFSLYYDNGTLISTQTSTSSSGGTLNVNADTSNNTGIYMNYYYIVNGTYFNSTSYWTIQDTGNKYSIFHFFTDLNLYLSAGLFGIDNFGKALIAFGLLVLISGFTIRRYGIQNEVSILGIIFGVILFLDTIGFLPEPTFNGITPLPHLIPILTGILFIGFFVKEEMR